MLFAMSFLNTDHKLVCIKKAESNGGYKHWFWHKGVGGVCGRQGMQKPFIAASDPIPVYNSDIRCLDRELQVGDTVFIMADRSFGTITEDIASGYVVYTHKSVTKSLNDSELMFVSASFADFKKINTVDKNLCGAQQQAELDFYEKYTSAKALLFLSKRLPHFKIGENLLLYIHDLIFSEIYEWGGQYRKENHELVVGKHEGATLDAGKVRDYMKHFFKNLNGLLSQASKDRKSLVTALVFLNKELCWIHPFVDGNGRTIRLLSEILANEWGYMIDWNMKANKKRKRAYHQAIRRSLREYNQCSKQLTHFIDSSLKSLAES